MWNVISVTAPVRSELQLENSWLLIDRKRKVLLKSNNKPTDN